MAGRTEEFTSFEAFELEFLPERHAARKAVSPWLISNVANDMATASIPKIQNAVKSNE